MISEFKIYPNYYEGFEFTWNIKTTCSDPFPWQFTIESSDTPYDNFETISPILLNVYRYQETERRLVSKDKVLHFRLKMVTPVSTYYSDVISPYWHLNKEEFLIARKIMHDEYIGQRNLVGVQSDVYIRAVSGPVCSCVDPITKDVLTLDCDKCYGTGIQPGYHGPYTTWCTFSPLNKQKGLQDDNTGPISNYALYGRITAVPELKKEDIIVDKTSGIYYYIDDINNIAELRRVPLAQMVALKQIPTSSPVYKMKGK